MDFIADKIIKYRRAVVALFLVLAIFGGAAFFGVGVNYSLADYLPEDAGSTVAMRVLEEEFGGGLQDTRVMAEGLTLPEAAELRGRLAAIDGVSELMWLGDVVDIKAPLEAADAATVESWYRDGTALFLLAVRDGDESRVLEEIRAAAGEGCAITGDSVTTASAQRLAVAETVKAAALLVPLVLIILCVSTTSWLEPLLFLLAVGAAVLINMGLNLFSGSISFMTYSVSPLLQFAVSLDYAIFLLHSFAEERAKTDDAAAAMRAAMKRSFASVTASALTTIFGFLALVFMRFGIGSDLGLNLVKGVTLSLLSVMVFLPALTIACCRLLDKTRHRSFMPKFRRAGGAVSRVRVPALLLVLLLAVPAFLAQSRNSFTYGMGELDLASREGRDKAAMEERFGAYMPVLLLVPRGDGAAEAALCEELAELPHVTSVLSYATAVGREIPQDFPDAEVMSNFYSENYCRIVVYTDTAADGEEAFSTVEALRAAAGRYYDGALTCGESAALYDMRDVITADSAKVNWIAIAAIGLVLLLTFRSLSLPLILLLTIETSIWINLSASYFTGTVLCYIGYLVISTVQLGATVDYAILFADRYKEKRAALLPKAAAADAVRDTAGSILTSAVTLSAAGFIIQLVSSNEVVSQLGGMLGRGTLISAAMVLLFLPAALSLLDGVVRKTTLRAGFITKKDAKGAFTSQRHGDQNEKAV